MNSFSGLMVRSGTPPTVEIDPSCHCAYIRFKRAKVEKTISRDSGKTTVAVDVDAGGAVIGVELVGVREFSIAAIRHYLPIEFKRGVNFERVRWMPATQVPCGKELQPA